MQYDQVKIDEAALALIGAYAQQDLGGSWVWKGFDFDIMMRLHERGLIDDPRNKNKSLRLTTEGLESGQAAAQRLFGIVSK